MLQYALVVNRAWDVDLSPGEKTTHVTNGLSYDITVVDIASMTPVQSLAVCHTAHPIRVDD